MNASNIERIHLGRLDVGNNHCDRHLFAALAESGQVDELLGRLGLMDARADVAITYDGNFGYTYAATWDVGELYDAIEKAAK